MGRPKKVKASIPEGAVEVDGVLATVKKVELPVAKPTKPKTHVTEYTPIQENTDAEEAALKPLKPSSPENTLEGKELPKVPGAAAQRQVSTKDLTAQRFASDVQKRVFERAEARKQAEEKRKADILKQAEEAAKGFKLIVIPYTDRNGEIVPAIVLGTVDQPKKDKGGPVLDENNEQIMECALRLFVLSNIDEPRKVFHTFGGK